MDRYIYDIPFYRCCREVHNVEMVSAVRSEKEYVSFISPTAAAEAFEYIEERTRQRMGGRWEFNQIIGWLRLYAAPSHIGGHLWFVDAKRITRNMRRKQFRQTTTSNVLATDSPIAQDSTAVFEHTLSCICSFAKQGTLQKRFIDLEPFKNIGPFINWRALLDDAARQNGSRI